MSCASSFRRSCFQNNDLQAIILSKIGHHCSNMSVAGIGELKSHVEGRVVSVEVHIIGGKINREMLPPLNGPPIANHASKHVGLSPKAQIRLKRQLRILKETFKPRDESRVLKTNEELKCQITYKALENVFSSALQEIFPSAKADRGMVFGTSMPCITPPK